MKRIIFVAILCAIITAPAAADPSWAKVSAELTGIGYTNVTNLTIDYSISQVGVLDSLLNSASDWKYGKPDTTASAVISTASGLAKTGSLYVYADSIATPPPGVESVSGSLVEPSNSAWQRWTFTASADGPVTFTFDSDATVALQTDLLGEEASGRYYVWLALNNVVSGGWDMREMAPILTEVQDGVDYLEALSDPFSVGLPFAAGQSGALMMMVQTYASANTVVPVPPAVLLGLLGLGASAVRLRKHV